MYLTNRRLSRRAVLRGVSASVALPFLDAMIPARVRASALKPPLRLLCLEMVHGAAGSSQIGMERNLWAPAAAGRDFDLSGTSLRGLAGFRDVLTIVSNTDCANAEPFTVREVGGDHFRSSAVFLTQSHPRMTEGADVEAGVSLDQIYAAAVGGATPLPSMQLSIEDVVQGGGCSGGYSCQYTDTISWASPTKPLPMIRDPRIAFDELFGVFGNGATPAEREARRREDRSILDGMKSALSRLQAEIGPGDRARVADYLDNVREVERRLQVVETLNRDGSPRELPAAPPGVPDSFTQHVRMMFDLQLLALRTDVTRVFAFKMGRDNSNRIYPESGFSGPFHPTSHHSGRLEKILDFEKLNAFHVGQVAYLLERMRQIRETDGTLLDNSVVLYGSAMGDSNLHNHKKVPFFVAGRAGGALRGGLHLKAPGGTPLANAMLGILRALGLENVERFGDSTAAMDLRG